MGPRHPRHGEARGRKTAVPAASLPHTRGAWQGCRLWAARSGGWRRRPLLVGVDSRETSPRGRGGGRRARAHTWLVCARGCACTAQCVRNGCMRACVGSRGRAWRMGGGIDAARVNKLSTFCLKGACPPVSRIMKDVIKCRCGRAGVRSCRVRACRGRPGRAGPGRRVQLQTLLACAGVRMGLDARRAQANGAHRRGACIAARRRARAGRGLGWGHGRGDETHSPLLGTGVHDWRGLFPAIMVGKKRGVSSSLS
ncbi:MAG: hypothetical protein J3K34DRAFT_424995 [Monoraphidium minutum]|nr:MAG: hypothetical protein J3K34DRAFT_424995 [Monoraphidium minutum]